MHIVINTCFLEGGGVVAFVRRSVCFAVVVLIAVILLVCTLFVFVAKLLYSCFIYISLC